MNRTTNIFILAIAIFLSSSLSMVGQANKYYLKVWGAVGYSNLIHDKIGNTNESLAKPMGGIGGLTGLGFEYHHKRFLFSIGGEFDYKNSYENFMPFILQVGTIVDSQNNPLSFYDIPNLPDNERPVIKDGTGMSDTDGEKFAMQYKFKEYSEFYQIGYVNVPLQFGMKYSTGLYFLAGGKFGLNIWGKADTKAKFTTRGFYPQAMYPFQDMPQHDFSSYKSGNSNPVKLNYNIIASVEVGKMKFFYTKRTRFHYRIAAFADYGVGAYFGMNPLPSAGDNLLTNVVSNGDFIGVPGINVADKNLTEVSIIQNNSILTSTQAIDKKLFPLLVGIKFTLLFDLGNKEPCNCIEDFEPVRVKYRRRR